MTEATLICKYCNHRWSKVIYNYESLDKSCPKCGDKDLIVEETNKNKIDYYCGKGPKKNDDWRLE